MRPRVVNISRGEISSSKSFEYHRGISIANGIVMSAISPSPFSGSELSTLPAQQRHWFPSDLTVDDLGAIDVGQSSAKRRLADLLQRLTEGVARRWQRERRRRKVGRAYDMALEIARVLPRGSHVLDVGCGNGFIAHHLGGMLDSSVTGIDLAEKTDALVNYRQFDGRLFPLRDRSVDAVLFCYVLHHAQDLGAILSEVRRTLRDGGLVVVYEDIPKCGWDQIVCGIHNRKWRGRTGPCTFRGEREWYNTFASAGFELCKTRQLSRWRNLAHPVSRRFFVLKFRTPA